ncbi:MAG: conjugal transfer protein TraH [Candidatus Midichloriaceae bacterium]|jgi:conjugative transfer pilus assembly protein TraH|nr:conjugal transfer protein TraH [Candidatus Midichloriaceae bacterium]
MKTLQILVLSIITIFSLIPCSLAKNVGESMKEFWAGAGGISNYNGGGAYQGQAAGYYTLGSMYARTPVKNTQIASLTLPSMKAGCGGINMHNGAFSFINTKELEHLIKAISNNSSGFATQLAISTISPVIGQKIEELQTWMQRINAMNINSCEAAATLVGGLWPRHERASANVCSTLANGSGIASDFVQAKHDCHNNKTATRGKLMASNKDSYDKLMIEDINLAWKAIRDSGFFALSQKESKDTQLAELFMTLSGTIVIRSNDNNPKYEYIGGRAAHNDVIQILMEGGDIKHHKCDEVDKCLNILREGGSHTIKAEDAFKSKIEKIIFTLVEKIKRDEPLNEEEKHFLNYKASIPLYKILNVYAAYSGAGALFELPAYTEAIALQMMFEYLNDVLRQVELASDNLIIASDDHLKRFKDNLRDVRRSLTERELKTHQSYSTLMKLVDRAMAIEGVLSNSLGSPMAESYGWSKNL